MSVIQKGIGVVWGISSTGYTYTAAATVLAVKGTGQTFRRSAEKFECKDGNDETIGLVFRNEKKELTLRCYPSSTTLALAQAANVLPAPGDKFVVTDAPDPDIAGTYIVDECSKEKVNSGITSFDIKVTEYATGDLSATIS